MMSTEIYTLSLHDALPISQPDGPGADRRRLPAKGPVGGVRGGFAGGTARHHQSHEAPPPGNRVAPMTERCFSARLGCRYLLDVPTNIGAGAGPGGPAPGLQHKPPAQL